MAPILCVISIVIISKVILSIVIVSNICNKLECLSVGGTNFLYQVDYVLIYWDIMGLYHPLDGDTNLKYKLLCLLTPNKKMQIERQ
jgi:hypothetical protein